MIIVRGEVYLEEGHIQVLRTEPEYVRKRYRAVARTLGPASVTREDAARLIGRSKRQLQRIVGRFREEGIPGLRFRAPHTTPRNRTPKEVEERIVAVRKATGFGSAQLAAIVNESLRAESRDTKVTDTTCYNILARNGLVEVERRKWVRYERTALWCYTLLACVSISSQSFPHKLL